MFGLQRLLYGPLRVIEVEQLYEKAWFAITETCLAMTIFREEVGGWFLVMFVLLLIGKVWGWIGEGRVEILEQQPPANPRLFHIRLSTSLIVSILFNLHMLNYSVQTVREQAEPNMMVMFAFEFAVLTVTSLSTAARYSISLHEATVIKNQTRLQLLERRAQMQRQREVAQEIAVRAGEVQPADSPSPQNENDSEEDVDVPGWEEKGRWVFYLDLVTGMYRSKRIPQINAKIITVDFFKLILYLSFFCVLCIFYGMPIHIIRDVAITIRSFYKRINDFVRYRHATRDMNERYPDAVAEEIAREDVCIICREIMRPWRTAPGARGAVADGAALREDVQAGVDARLRPKKLPCGHILHFACLRSWLERQQNCPTCRRPVIVSSSTTVQTPVVQAHNQQAREQPIDNLANVGAALPGTVQQENPGQNRIRVFNFGPFRLGFGAGQDIRGIAQQLNRVQPPHQQQFPGPALGTENQLGNIQNTSQSLVSRVNSNTIQAQLQGIEQQLMQQINGLRAQADQLYMVRALQGELARLRILQATQAAAATTNVGEIFSNSPQASSLGNTSTTSTIHTFGANQQPIGMRTGTQELPPGLAVPDGWTLLPLQRLSHSTPSPISAVLPSRSPQTQRIHHPALAQSQPIASHPRLDIATLPNHNGNNLSTGQSTSSLPHLIHSIDGPHDPGQQPQNSDEGCANEFFVADGRGGTSTNSERNKATAAGSGSAKSLHESTSIGEKSPMPLTVSRSASPDNGQSAPKVGGRENKGKGRAVTVEDAVDDLD